MRQQVKIAGRTYSDVPRISVPDANNVYHSFIDEGELNTYYEGSTAPSSSLGEDGDIYLDTTGGGGGTPNLQAKTNISPTTSSQTITADNGYDGLSSVQINAMPTGSATAPSTISGSSASVSTGTNTLTLSKTVSVTPTVSAGYVSSGTAGNSSVSLTASVTTKGATTHHPSTSDQTISSSTYLTGTQTIKAVTMTNLTAGNIKDGVTIKIGDSTDDDCVTSVTGTYTGGGGGGSTALVPVKIRRSATTSYDSKVLVNYYSTSSATYMSGGYLTSVSTSSFQTVYLPPNANGNGLLILCPAPANGSVSYYGQVVTGSSTGVVSFLTYNPSAFVVAECSSNAEVYLTAYYDN